MIVSEAVSKAWKTLENEEGYKRCQEIVEEAKSRVDEAVCHHVVDGKLIFWGRGGELNVSDICHI